MPQASLDSHASELPFFTLPLCIEHRSSRLSSLIVVTLLGMALVGLVLPVWLLAVFAVPALWIATDSPGAALQVLGGLAVWTGLFVLPAKGLLARFGTSRTIRIEAGRIAVLEQRLLGRRAWNAPLSQFIGVTHMVRASISGLHHELILVHVEPGRCVLLHRADRISQPMMDRACALLALPQVPARELYRFAARRPGARQPVLPLGVAQTT